MFLYVLKDSLFPCPKSSGKHKVSGIVEGSCFRDFADHKTTDQILEMPLEKRPALIVIDNYKEFKRKLYCKLKALGVKEKEILIKVIRYEKNDVYETMDWMDFNYIYPNELFYKNKSFTKQSELRIIINTKKAEVIKYLDENFIDLGTMEKIAKVSNEYFYDGIKVDMTMDIDFE